jgi:hypothetical protein
MMNPSGTEFPGDKIVSQSDLRVGTASDRIINEEYVNKKIKRGDSTCWCQWDACLSALHYLHRKILPRV